MAPSRQKQPPTIVLVDEEPSIRQAIARALQDGGFVVIEAVDSDAGLALLESRPDLRGLVVDAHVPGKIDGFELASLAHQRWPHLAVVMMSGHSDATSGPVAEGIEFIAKPYLPTHLVPTLNRMMGRA